MNENRLLVLAVVILLGAVIFAAVLSPQNAPDACANVPVGKQTAQGSAPKLQIRSPENYEILDANRIEQTIRFSVENFDLTSGSNTIRTWLDGVPFDAEVKLGSISLSSKAIMAQGVKTLGNDHNLCLALWDSASGSEVSNRTGIRFRMVARGPDQIDPTPFIQLLCLVGFIGISLLTLAAVMLTRGARQRRRLTHSEE